MSDFTVCLTHDVDRVYKSFQYITHDLLHLKFGKLGDFFSKKNPYWVFENIMSLEDKHGVRSSFFFLEESIRFNFFSPTVWKLALGKYKFSDPKVGEIIRQLDSGGWEVGLHGSYESYHRVELLKNEKKSLENIVGKAVLGIRQHYLNLNIPETWVLQKSAGFAYDASLGIKNTIGFPNKTYHPFVDEKSGLFIIPLALMDGYLFSNSKNFEEGWLNCLKLIEEAEKNHAVLVVLWHQRVFNEREFPEYQRMYEKLIIECKRRNASFLLCRELL